MLAAALGLVAMWLAFAPNAVTRAEMVSYVEVTATEHLRILRGDFRCVTKELTKVRERLAAVEGALREQPSR
jgi:hypothetical protein